jgi:hypothetical protein
MVRFFQSLASAIHFQVSLKFQGIESSVKSDAILGGFLVEYA